MRMDYRIFILLFLLFKAQGAIAIDSENLSEDSSIMTPVVSLVVASCLNLA